MSVLDEIQKNFSSGNPENVTAETPAVEVPQVETENQVTETNLENTDVNIVNEVPNSPSLPSTEKPVEVIKEDVKVKFANEELAEANDFISRNPDKSLSDYYSLKKPIGEFSEDDLIKNYLTEKGGMSKDEIESELLRLDVSGEDDDFADVEDVEALKVERQKVLDDAKKYREDFVSEQLGKSEKPITENQETQPTVESFLENAKKTHEAERAEYIESIYGAISEIKEVPLDLNGEKISFKPDEEFMREMRLGSEDLSNIGKEFFDNGKIKDAKGFIQETTLWANPATRKPMLQFMIEQAIARHDIQKDKVRRNINFNNSDNGSAPNTNSDTKNAVENLLNRKKRASF